MQNNFNSEYVEISVGRNNVDNGIRLEISSDYSRSDRKSQLYVNEKSLALEVEKFWKSIKTKKLIAMNVSFGEIDWYDDEVDVYTTPSITIKRGLKKARISESTHGSIPKDWSFDFVAVFNDTTTITPILEVVKATLGSWVNEKFVKDFRKAMKPFLQKKSLYANYTPEIEVQRSRSYY